MGWGGVGEQMELITENLYVHPQFFLFADAEMFT